jgi:hypothetical protein
MRENTPGPQINVSKIVAGGGIAGTLFTLCNMFPAAVVSGGGVALVLHFRRHETTGASWILSAPRK